MKILLVDDHALVRAGVGRLLSSEVGAVIREANSSQEALEIYRRERPDLVVLDLNLICSSGLDLLRRLVQLDKSSKVLVLSMHAEPVYTARALQIGARGYISKTATADEFVDAVRRVAQGGWYIEREIAIELAFGRVSKIDPLDNLTAREIDILRLLGDGKSYTQISVVLGTSYKTIANSTSVIREKLNVGTTADLIRLSIETRRK